MQFRTFAANGTSLGHAGFVAVLAALLVVAAFPPVPTPAIAGPLLAIVLVAAVGRRVGPRAVIAMAAAGLALRLGCVGLEYSDVLPVTGAAIERAMSGLNPYGVGYEISLPPGAPFPYGPLALAWYLPAAWMPRLLEISVSVAVLAALALRGRPLGLALYAFTPALFVTAVDGSNDTSAGLLILLALVAMRRSTALGGVLLAAAIAFKPYAAAWAPAFAAWAGWGGALALVAASAAFWGPAFLAWGVGPIADSVGRAAGLHEVGEPSRSLARAVSDLTGIHVAAGLCDRFRFVAGAAVAAVGLRLVRSSRDVVLAGLAVFLVVLYTGYWSTTAYLAAIAPIVCWYLDEWLGIVHRVALPGDPAARIERWLDRRLPLREAALPPLGVPDRGSGGSGRLGATNRTTG